MKFLGIQFASLRIPVHRRLETLCAFIITFFTTYFGIFSLVLSISCLLCPLCWPLFIPYLVWMLIDKETPEKGSRPKDWIRSLSVFKYAKKYYPISVKFHSELKLDPRKNYLFCYFPHGTITTGPLLAFLPKTFENKVFFPNHQIFAITLNGNFFIPFYRETLLLMGFCSATAKSINWLLGDPKGGNIVGLVVGGAAEAYHEVGRNYRVVLKNRKGFVRLALKNGSPLVPCFTFGETRLFKQYNFSKESLIRRIQEWFQKKHGAAPIFFYGRGFFQYTFGWLPFRHPINLVVGDQIDVPKIENPSESDVDTLHNKFISALQEIFEKYKYDYELHPEQCSLIIS